MLDNLKNINNIYGKAYVQIPNDIFKKISSGLGDGKKSNINQSSFAYCYLVIVSFLYKYAHFVDLENNSYIQNGDIKEILGYGRTTKTIDSVIKKNGILDSIGLSETIRNYPVGVDYIDDTVDEIKMREFIYIEDIRDTQEYIEIKKIVKNRNYEVKEPLFLFDREEELGTLFDYSNTHRVKIEELLYFLSNESMGNIDMMLYFYFKYKCYGRKKNLYSISLSRISLEMGISRDTFYRHFEKLQKNGLLSVKKKRWTPKTEDFESNEYIFKGI